MEDREKQEELRKLKQLYEENLEFLNLFNGNNSLAYKQVKETLNLLKKYILELDNGEKLTTNCKEWCNRLAQAIDKFYDEIKPRRDFNDDNFYIDEDGEEW